MSVIFKAQPGSLEFPATFYVDLIEAIDQDVGDAGIFQKRLERAQAEDFIQNFPRKALTLGEAERYGYTVNSIADEQQDRKSTRLNSSHSQISYAVFCLKKKKNIMKISQGI